MDYRILGPLEVTKRDGPVPIGGAKQRALLAVLLLHANEVVSSDRLIDALWGERPPDTAAKALQVHVSQLRKAIGAGALQTRAPGYALELGPDDDLDLDRFGALHAGAREALAHDPERARRLLTEAMSLWRGPALADFAYEPFAQAEIARMDELRAAAVEDRIAADLALGRHPEVIGELDALIAEHPHRERLRAQHMLALYRSGRQAEALDAYQRARDTLTGQLGIEPSRELRDLQHAILEQDPKLDLPAAPGRDPAAAQQGHVFVGRDPELGVLLGALSDALAGRGRLVLVAGEPGIGKSRLAEELASRAGTRGARVLAGRCWEAGGAPAFWPWVQSLRAYAESVPAEELRGQLGAGAAELAQLLPELRDRFPDLPEPLAADSEGARFHLFEAVGAFLRRASATAPIVLVLDDLHAADEPSLLMLRFVVRGIAGSHLLVVAAYRDVDPTVGESLSTALADLVRERHTVHVSLDGLTKDELAEYLELATEAAASPDLVRAIHDETEGNPLFVTEVVRLLDAEGRLRDPDAERRIPASVRAVIGRRVGRLTPGCRGVLEAAAVIGREFDLEPLGPLAGMTRDDLLTALDEAMAERVVGDVPGATGRLRFGHALIRDTLYDELTAARRMQLHGAAGEALEAAYGQDPGSHLAELARHFLAAAPTGTADRAVDYARRAGDRAAAQLAFEEASRQYEAALELVSDPRERCELLLRRGDAEGRAGDAPAARATARAAADIAEEHGLAEHLARAALGYGGRMLWDVSRADDHYLTLLERALDAVGPEDSPVRVQLLARTAGGPLRDARYPIERKHALSEEALAMARRIGDPVTLAFGIDGYILAHHSPDHTERQLELGTELLEVATRAGDKERIADGHEERLDALFELGDVEAARAELDAMTALAKELRQPSHDWFAAVYGALFELFEGRLDEAETAIADTRRAGELAQGWNAVVTHSLQLYLLRRFQGRLAEIEDMLRARADENPTYPVCRCVLAQALAELGHADEARATVAALTADGLAGLPFDEEWLVSVGLLIEAATTARGADVADLYERLLPYADRIAISYPEISTGSVARYLGLAAAHLERFDDAERHLRHALEVNERTGARPWLEHTREDLARLQARMG